MSCACLWAYGVYSNVRLDDEANARQCILVLMGATPEGRKELIAGVIREVNFVDRARKEVA